MCPPWYLVISAVLSLFCHHCYSCCKTSRRFHELIVCFSREGSLSRFCFFRTCAMDFAEKKGLLVVYVYRVLDALRKAHKKLELLSVVGT